MIPRAANHGVKIQMPTPNWLVFLIMVLGLVRIFVVRLVVLGVGMVLARTDDSSAVGQIELGQWSCCWHGQRSCQWHAS